MARVIRGNQPNKTKRSPATTPQGRENQLIFLATELAEQQLRDGTASAQVISHYLKLGSSREVLEQERIRKENELLDAKREALAAAQRVEDMYAQAMAAFRSYSGQEPSVDDGVHDDY